MRVLKYLGAVLIVAAMFLLVGCGAAAQLQEYDMSGDTLASINAIVGDRKVSGVATGTENGMDYKRYTYSSDSVMDDLLEYCGYLRDNGWIITEDYNLEVVPGIVQMGNYSTTEGKILIITIEYTSSDYTVNLNKLVGSFE